MLDPICSPSWPDEFQVSSSIVSILYILTALLTQSTVLKSVFLFYTKWTHPTMQAKATLMQSFTATPVNIFQPGVKSNGFSHEPKHWLWLALPVW